jgi:hypothetical protein
MGALVVAMRIGSVPASACGCFGSVGMHLGFAFHFAALGLMLSLAACGFLLQTFNEKVPALE